MKTVQGKVDGVGKVQPGRLPEGNGLITIVLPGVKPTHAALGMLSIDLLPQINLLRKHRATVRDAYLRLGAVLVQIKAQVLHGEYVHTLTQAGINRKTAAKAVHMLVLAFDEVDGAGGDKKVGERYIDKDRMEWSLRQSGGRRLAVVLGGDGRVAGVIGEAGGDARPTDLRPTGAIATAMAIAAQKEVAWGRSGLGVVLTKCSTLGTFGKDSSGDVHTKCSTSGTFGKERLGGGGDVVGGGAEDGGRGRPPHRVGRDAAGQMRMDELYLAADRIRAFAREVQEGRVDAAVLGRVLGEIAGGRVAGGDARPTDARPTGGGGGGGEKRT